MSGRGFSRAITLLASLLFIPWAWADLAIIVHPDNPQQSISKHELRLIFLGRMPLFPTSGEEIIAFDLPESDSGYETFYRNVVELEGTRLKRYRAYYLFSGRGKLPRPTDSNATILQQVADNERAIGYVDSRLVNEKVKVLLTLPER
ncbi:type 2 periplasmic-binding domain-containing protein [Ketobacter alkanivorans]|uniref:Phosphate ABC transporter substrate-binding protein n=1 Tax=Ketobacter alkanivorans TaxID=1917421 RepID=A0A2K9LJU9_9GAMM|nr:hypothetical protein [Ketobacter alkanivorans]AUM12618.1 hypothetical protein Kalk_09405 [Ketobacter alkanivorans]